MRVAGIDPGTRSFDLVVLEEDRVYIEKSFDTVSIAREPSLLIDFLESIQVDYITAPSGYGVPVVTGNRIRDPIRFAEEVLLLSSRDAIREGVEKGEVGVWVYDALVKINKYIIEKYRDRALFIPGVIHLPTIPWYRKINKVDMGTVDKLAATTLAVHEVSTRRGVGYNDTSLLLVELGFGYNAVIGVKNGIVVDGIGGTYASTGTLTSGALDLEVVVGSGYWKRWDVFHGGLFNTLGVYNIDAFIEGYEEGREPYYSLFNAFIESIVKDVMRVSVSTRRIDTVVLTGRFSRDKRIVKYLGEQLADYEVLTLRGLRGASISKEAAQGYAIIGEGIAGGFFKKLVDHMKIRDACGTVVDYITHPRARGFVERVRKAYVETVEMPRLCTSTLSSWLQASS